MALGLSFASKAQRPTARPARLLAVPVAQVGQARYAQLDQFARQLPENQATTLNRLSAALATLARSDEEKARLIFTWIAYHIAYDIAGVQGSAEPHVTAEQALTSRLAICQGYTDLFTTLATRLNLKASTVVGYAHVDPTRSAPALLGTDGSHAWNVCYTTSGAHIVDACWGAGVVSADYAKFTQRFDPFWFNTPPDQAIFMHWPVDATWQLLPTPVDSITFRQWPYLSSSWFKLGVSAASMRHAVALGKGKMVVQPLPRLYATPHEVRIVQVPRQAVLVAGQAATFVFTVGPGIEVGLEGHSFVMPAEAQGKYRRLTIAPAAGAVPRIVTWHQDSTQFSFLLEYQVAPALRRAAPPRRGVTDSVTYLRR